MVRKHHAMQALMQVNEAPNYIIALCEKLSPRGATFCLPPWREQKGRLALLRTPKRGLNHPSTVIPEDSPQAKANEFKRACSVSLWLEQIGQCILQSRSAAVSDPGVRDTAAAHAGFRASCPHLRSVAPDERAVIYYTCASCSTNPPMLSSMGASKMPKAFSDDVPRHVTQPAA